MIFVEDVGRREYEEDWRCLCLLGACALCRCSEVVVEACALAAVGHLNYFVHSSLYNKNLVFVSHNHKRELIFLQLTNIVHLFARRAAATNQSPPRQRASFGYD